MPQVKTPPHLATAEKIVSFLEQEYEMKFASHLSRALLVVKIDRFLMDHFAENLMQIGEELSHAQG